jgi:hypothetical protein
VVEDELRKVLDGEGEEERLCLRLRPVLLGFNEEEEEERDSDGMKVEFDVVVSEEEREEEVVDKGRRPGFPFSPSEEAEWTGMIGRGMGGVIRGGGGLTRSGAGVVDGLGISAIEVRRVDVGGDGGERDPSGGGVEEEWRGDIVGEELAEWDKGEGMSASESSSSSSW